MISPFILYIIAAFSSIFILTIVYAAIGFVYCAYDEAHTALVIILVLLNILWTILVSLGYARESTAVMAMSIPVSLLMDLALLSVAIAINSEQLCETTPLAVKMIISIVIVFEIIFNNFVRYRTKSMRHSLEHEFPGLRKMSYKEQLAESKLLPRYYESPSVSNQVLQ
ncbi:Hypothetical protein NTJ_01021 [Nesidiocoris tenuis]|uniref:Uncharacterized protein n=1 Tax=Nesidiocoris tenuis TaxID=355587 RepID=A0ABN7ABK2_9HEMI|nr:Hypothetical protein NTJ_01021 [Nesidiocoris tenuis]